MTENKTLAKLYKNIEELGLTSQEVADICGLKRATLITKMRRFCKQNNLPTPFKKGRPLKLITISK